MSLKKPEKDNKGILIIILSSLILILGILAINKKDNEIIIKSEFNNKLLEKYNNNLKTIEENLDYITYDLPENSIRWYRFKYENIDETSLNVINMLIRDIREFYAFSNDNGEIYYYDNNYVGKFNNIDKISKKEFLKKIEGYETSNNSYVKLFDKYEDFFLNGGAERFMNLKLLIDPLITFDKTINNSNIEDYEDLLINEYNKSLFLKNITIYLKNYYEDLTK